MSEPLKIIGHENQTPVYTNAFFLYPEAGGIVINLGFIDQLPDVVRETFDFDTEQLDNSDIEENDSVEVKSIGRFVVSYDLASALVEKLEELLKETTEKMKMMLKLSTAQNSSKRSFTWNQKTSSIASRYIEKPKRNLSGFGQVNIRSSLSINKGDWLTPFLEIKPLFKNLKKELEIVDVRIIDKANKLIRLLHSITHENNLWWYEPLGNISIDQEMVFEWWHQKKSLTIYIGPKSIDFIKAWGADMDNEMEDGLLSLNKEEIKKIMDVDSNLSNDIIDDKELMYRCVFYGRNCYEVRGNSTNILSQAFADRSRKPSVDRAKLCNFNPSHSQRDFKDGVVSLIVQNVRLIDSVIQNDSKGSFEFTYKIDVKYRPLPDNIAHAQIEPNPKYRNNTPFKKLLIRLARLANQRGWEIEPYELRRD